jgi:hypothetical protein
VTTGPDLQRLLAGVRDRDVEFASVGDAGPASLERRIVVVAPPELAELTGTGDVRVLDHLVGLLDVPGRAWAAQVALSAMTRRDEKLVEANQSPPDEWLDTTVGRGACARWTAWLAEHRDRLTWHPETRTFTTS